MYTFSEIYQMYFWWTFQALGLLRLVVLDNYDVLKQGIVSLDPFPNTKAFTQLLQTYNRLKFSGGTFSLQQVSSYYLTPFSEHQVNCHTWQVNYFNPYPTDKFSHSHNLEKFSQFQRNSDDVFLTQTGRFSHSHSQINTFTLTLTTEFWYFPSIE